MSKRVLERLDTAILMLFARSLRWRVSQFALLDEGHDAAAGFAFVGHAQAWHD